MKRRSKYEGLQKRKAIAGYIFILPFIVGFLAFMVKPFIQSFYMSLCDVQINAGAGYTNVFVGLKNYRDAFMVDVDFNRLVTEELGRMAVNVLAIMVLSFFVSLLLNQEFKGRAFVRAVFFLPVILSSGAIIGVEYNNSIMADMRELVEMNGDGTGITDTIKNILNISGVGNTVFNVVFDIVDGVYDVILASGIQIIIFLSGLQTIPRSMYEAASIEGCTAWESLWKITFPMISPLLLVNWVYTIVDFCMRTDNQVMKKIDKVMFELLNYGSSSAMSWAYFGIVIALIGISSFIISKVVYYYD